MFLINKKEIEFFESEYSVLCIISSEIYSVNIKLEDTINELCQYILNFHIQRDNSLQKFEVIIHGEEVKKTDCLYSGCSYHVEIFEVVKTVSTSTTRKALLSDKKIFVLTETGIEIYDIDLNLIDRIEIEDVYDMTLFRDNNRLLLTRSWDFHVYDIELKKSLMTEECVSLSGLYLSSCEKFVYYSLDYYVDRINIETKEFCKFFISEENIDIFHSEKEHLILVHNCSITVLNTEGIPIWKYKKFRDEKIMKIKFNNNDTLSVLFDDETVYVVSFPEGEIKNIVKYDEYTGIFKFNENLILSVNNNKNLELYDLIRDSFVYKINIDRIPLEVYFGRNSSEVWVSGHRRVYFFVDGKLKELYIFGGYSWGNLIFNEEQDLLIIRQTFFIKILNLKDRTSEGFLSL